MSVEGLEEFLQFRETVGLILEAWVILVQWEVLKFGVETVYEVDDVY